MLSRKIINIEFIRSYQEIAWWVLGTDAAVSTAGKQGGLRLLDGMSCISQRLNNRYSAT
jgi:hypothetical protein